jgi:hypothetical protein
MAVASASSALFSLLSRPFVAYNALLEKQPFVTKSVTSGVMYAAGDAVAQVGESRLANEARAKAGERATLFALNWQRAGVFLVYGTVIAGPLYHTWFGSLDLLPGALLRLRQHQSRTEIMRAYATLRRHGIEVSMKLDALPVVRPWTKTGEKVIKILADQLIFSSFYTLVFFMGIGLAQGAVEKISADARGHSLEQASEVIRRRYGGAEKKDDSASSKRNLLRIKSLLAQSDIEDDSIDRVLALLAEEERKTHIEWRTIAESTWAHTKEVYWPTYAADCVVWPGLQWVNFTFVPLRFQVLYVNVCNLAWNAFLSFQSNKH